MNVEYPRHWAQSLLLFHYQTQNPGLKAIYLPRGYVLVNSSFSIYSQHVNLSYVYLYLSVPYPGHGVKGAVVYSEVGSFEALEQRLW
jgi:hypothetical protein